MSGIALRDDTQLCFFFFQAEDGIRDVAVTGVQTCALPICLTDGGIQRAPILSAIDGQWSTFDAARKERMIGWLAEALSRQLGKTNPPTDGEVERGTAIINARILKYGFKFENGGFVPVNAVGQIPS